MISQRAPRPLPTSRILPCFFSSARIFFISCVLADGSWAARCELLSALDGVCYLERTAVSTPKDVNATKRAIKKAFQNQIDGKGFSLVEVLSMCPTDWKLSTEQSVDFVNNDMKKVFPLGVIKDKS